MVNNEAIEKYIVPLYDIDLSLIHHNLILKVYNYMGTSFILHHLVCHALLCFTSFTSTLPPNLSSPLFVPSTHLVSLTPGQL